MSTTAKGFASYSIIDVVDGMIWKGDLSSHPSNPERSWAYYNTTNKQSYLYDGSRWVVFVKDGVAGNSVTSVVNYYYAHTSDSSSGLPVVGNSKWKTKVSDLSPAFNATNKYLWNYERVSYSSATATTTEPSLIGTYSKDGVSISGVEEYYLVNASSSKPTTLPSISNTNGWTKGSASTLPQTTKDKPYLWNYQIVSYSDGSTTASGPLCIGTYGNSIKSTTEYYAATETEDAPGRYSSGTTVDTSVWKTTIADCGQSETKPYVWNFERVAYTLDGDKDTEVALLTRSPRQISTITEYYQIKSDGSTPAAPYFSSTDTNHNNIPTVQTAWSTTRPSMTQGDTLWNCEIIKYNTVDGNGKNLYAIIPPATVAYVGIDGNDAVNISMVVDNATLKKNNSTYTPTSTKVSIYKRVGSGSPALDTTTYYYSIFVDGSSTAKPGSSTSTGQITVGNNSATRELLVVIYSDPSRTQIVDKVTISIVSDGTNGTRGTGILPVTTSPYSSSSSIGGVSYEYYLSLSDVINQSKVSEVLIGDVIESGTYHYPVVYIGTSLVYCGPRTSIQGGKPPVSSTVTAYISQNDYSDSVSTPTGTSLSGGWTLTKPPCNSSNPFIYRCEVTQTVTYSSNTDLTGTTEYGPWGTPELIEASVGGSAVDPVAYATFVKLTNNETECGLVNQNGTVMINANYIRTGVLKVGPAGSELLSANMKDGILALNGWDITASYGLRSRDGKVGIASPFNSSLGLYKLSLVSPADYSKMAFYANNEEVTVSGSINSTIPNFCILEDGSLYAKYANISGTITTNQLNATGGTIGGFTIGSFRFVDYDNAQQALFYGFTKNSSGYYEYPAASSFLISPNGSYMDGATIGNSGTGYWKLIIGQKFGIMNGGYLYATAGQIGGWTLNESYLSSSGCYLYSKDQTTNTTINGISQSNWRICAGSNFGVDSDGNVYCSSAKLGDYTFSIENGIVFDNYDVDAARNAALTMRDWQMGGNSFYGIRLQTPEGVNVATGGFDSVGYSAIHSAKTFTFYRGGGGGEFVGANTTNVRSLVIEANWGSSSTYDYIKLPNTMIGTTNSWNMYIDSDQFQFKNGSTVVGELETYSSYVDIQGTFKTNGNNWISSSDAKVKKEIASPTTEYEVLFDNLNPRTYKFINGTSDRTHSGFIVQEVLEAIKQAGLSSQSFAAVCAFGDPNNENTEWGFRYEEVISLNTWQIQLLKPRMTAAEQEILELKEEVRRLSAELENLKNS